MRPEFTHFSVRSYKCIYDKFSVEKCIPKINTRETRLFKTKMLKPLNMNQF